MRHVRFARLQQAVFGVLCFLFLSPSSSPALPSSGSPAYCLIPWAAAAEEGSPSERPTVSSTLPPLSVNRDSHTSYMTGKTTTLFAPSDSLTRAEITTILYRLLEEKPPITKTFHDVGTQWFATAANSLYSAGILRSADGSFYPNRSVTRAELAELLYRLEEPILSLVPEVSSARDALPSFTDVSPQHPAYSAITAVTAQGWMVGYSNQQFRPEQLLNRAEAAVTINRFLGRSPDSQTVRNAEGMPVFLDVEQDMWAYEDILEATVSHTHTIIQTTAGYTEQWTSFSASPTGLATGYYLFDHYLYYVEAASGQFVRNTSRAGYTFDENGKYTTGNAELDTAIHAVVVERCTNEMASEANLHQVYNYVRDNFTYAARPHIARGATGWDLDYAVPMMQTHRGNCYSWASVFTYLARAIGFEAYSQSGAVGVRVEDHGWTEIAFNGVRYIFDPELEHANKGRWSFFKIPYENGFKTYYKYNT